MQRPARIQLRIFAQVIHLTPGAKYLGSVKNAGIQEKKCSCGKSNMLHDQLPMYPGLKINVAAPVQDMICRLSQHMRSRIRRRTRPEGHP
jgi:hypothetical protein